MVIKVPDYCLKGEDIEWEELEKLRPIADCDLRDLPKQLKDPHLLVFPKELGKHYHDGLDEKEKYICKISGPKMDTGGKQIGKLVTGDLLGFVGYEGTELTIHSRFAKDEKEENDFFLHYVVQKVLNINLFELKHSSAKDKVFDFLACLFPHYLKEALRQGMYKQYVVRRYNDSNVRGTIDVARHIKMNIPFAGKIAYNVREYSHDNSMTQLIRHAIEYIRTTRLYSVLKQDADTESYVAQICEATPSYKKQDRIRVISKNLKSPTHPYFHKYIALQELCIKILTHKNLKYGNDGNQIYGLLFSGSWLWEEYLHKAVLKDCGFKHPENKTGKGAIALLRDNINNRNRYPRFPDYYKDGVVLDAKYKHMVKEENSIIVARDDMHQIISYMFVLSSKIGGFIHPTDEATLHDSYHGTLYGYGGNIHVISVPIPSDADSYADFTERMGEVESELRKIIKKITNQP